VGLALCTLGNIASVEMSRDLFTEIENAISTSNPYIRRKAALCAMRICRKVPDLREHFIEKAKLLLQDRNHGVLLCGVTLVSSFCEEDDAEDAEESSVELFKPLVPTLVRTLKALTSSGYAPEHDVTGITDPFLQVKILRLLRMLGKGDSEVSEQINDILAQVATNTDSSKNVGNSILYEAVLTILDIEADSGLRVLGVNILGKFLSNRDNNIRYVALNTLVKVVAVEPQAVQRHRNTILECLRDPDISIRRRALELSFTLINESNVRVLIRELLAFLEVADNEFKPTLTMQICIAADRFSPEKQWHIDTVLRVLKLAGNYVKEQILSSFIRLVATTPEFQTYTALKLYQNLQADITQEGLTLAAAWIIGEFGDALLKSTDTVNEKGIIDLFETVLNSSYATPVVNEYVLTALMKLTTRFSDPAQIERIRRTLITSSSSLDIEIQQRAVEYANLFGYDEVRRGVLEKMPPPEIREEERVLGERAGTKAKKGNAANNKKKLTVKKTGNDMLLDLMGDGGDLTSPVPASANGGAGNADLLANLLGDGPPASAVTSPTIASGRANDDILSLFSPTTSQPAQNTQSLFSPTTAGTPTPASSGLAGLSSPLQSSTPQPSSANPTYLAFQKAGLTVTLQLQHRAAENIVNVMARFKNASGGKISALNLQAAVPKSQKIQLQAISKAEINGGEEASQAIRVSQVANVSFPIVLYCHTDL
jgi:AP-1 complex subunit gamma-1